MSVQQSCVYVLSVLVAGSVLFSAAGMLAYRLPRKWKR